MATLTEMLNVEGGPRISGAGDQQRLERKFLIDGYARTYAGLLGATLIVPS